jgi:protein-tyrosine phosphatase
VASATAGSFWVVEGRVLAGKYPGARFDGDTGSTLEALLQAGVRTFVDLTKAGELLPYTHALPEGVAHTRVAIKDMSCPEQAQVREALDRIDAGLDRGVVYVHCRGGCGRTGVIVGCYLVRLGEAPPRALQRVDELTRVLGEHPCPETREQRALVETWAEDR